MAAIRVGAGVDLMKRLGPVVLAAVLFVACHAVAPPPERIPLRIAGASRGGTFYPVAEELTEHYAKAMPRAAVSVHPTAGSVANLSEIEHHRAELAFSQADLAYRAFRHGIPDDPQPYKHLRGVAVLWMHTLQIVVPRDRSIQDISDLSGHVVATGPVGSAPELFARFLLDLHDVAYVPAPPSAASRRTPIDALIDDSADAFITLAGFPLPVIVRLNAMKPIRLVGVSAGKIRTLRERYPFVQPVVIPAGTYAGQQRPVQTIGIHTILMCRDTLAEDLVYELTKVLFESLPTFSKREASVGQFDPEQASATPIPLHSGAARFYRAREILK